VLFAVYLTRQQYFYTTQLMSLLVEQDAICSLHKHADDVVIIRHILLTNTKVGTKVQPLYVFSPLNVAPDFEFLAVSTDSATVQLHQDHRCSSEFGAFNTVAVQSMKAVLESVSRLHS
jgi:hypothetical protein